MRQKTDEESGMLNFSASVRQMQNESKIDEQIMAELKKLWEFQNQINSNPAPDKNISDEVQLIRVVAQKS